MPGKVFLDTNILVYAIETKGPDPVKAATALALARRKDICVSTQVLGEFYQAVTSARRQVPLSHVKAVAWIQLWKRYDVRTITSAHVDLALELTARNKINYYDALILAAAELAECKIVYSEDLNPNQSYGKIKIKDPFARSE